MLCRSVNAVLLALAPKRRGGDPKCRGSLLKRLAFRQDMHNMLALEVFELAVMGIGKLGAISRVLLARAGSVLIYASISAATDVEGQMSLEQLRALGFGP